MDPRDAALAVLALCLTLSLAAHGLARLRRAAGPPREEAEAEHLHDRIWRIAESEDRYRALVEATTDVIVQRDALGRIAFASEGFGRLMGRDALDLVGTAADLDVLESGPVEAGPDGVRRFEARLRPAAGPPRWFAFVEIPVARGDAVHWLRAGRDVTARIEAARSLDEALARAEAANVAKSRFLATVSHEFRTPLNGILGMADLLLATGPTPEQRTYAEAVRSSGQALLALIDGILDFSRIEAGRLDLAAEPFDPAALAEAVVELLAPRAQDKGLEIALDAGPDVPALVIGDADRVRQILVNLAGNAVKFTSAGGVGVTVEGAPEGIVLAVSDTGPGIPEERIPKLFEEFEQGDGSASRSHEGTGLGLAITRRLVSSMGGRIEATSRVGEGSTFRVHLPLRAGEARRAPRGASHRPLSGRRVLVAADSPFQAPYIARALSRLGAQAVVAAGAEAALDALAGASFDTLVADRSLGDGPARRLAEAARAAGAGRCLILLSPFDRRASGAAAGFDGYLVKPVRARSLLDRLRLREAPPAPAPALPAPAAPASGAGLRVLLAEDNPINALLARRALERLGAAVVHAADGAEALALAEDAGPFDLALVDIRMPGLDGHETARRIRAREAAREKEAGGAGRLHLVALTANAGRGDEAAARAAGFDGFLPKPLNLDALPALLAACRAEATRAA